MAIKNVKPENRAVKRASMLTRARLFSVMALAILLTLAGGCGQPQIGTDREAFKAVDALFTAVSLRDPKLVEGCAATLKQLRDSGKLPDDAFKTIDAIIDDTRAGHWEPSQERLIRFMEAQRR